MKNNIKTISIALFLAVIVFISLVFINTRVSGSDHSVQVVVATKQLEHNTQITESNVNEYFKIVSVNEDAIPPKAVNSLEGIAGRYVSADVIYANSVICTPQFSKTADVLKDYSSPIRASFSVAALGDAVCGRIRSGDHIDVYGVSQSKGQIILRNVYVENVYDNAGVAIANTDTSSIATNFTVVVESGNELDLYEAVKSNTVIITKVK